MLEIRKAAVSLDKRGLTDLERIITDTDGKGTFQFLKRRIYGRILHSQQGRLLQPLSDHLLRCRCSSVW